MVRILHSNDSASRYTGYVRLNSIQVMEKLTWLVFIALIAVAFAVTAFTAPQLNNQILAGIMSAVFGFVFIITLKD